MKKWSIIVLIFSTIFVSALPSSAEKNNFETIANIQEFGQINEEIRFIGAKSFNMLNPNNVEYEDVEIVIDEFSIYGSELKLLGRIDNKNINLFGTIYQSRIHKGKLVIDSEDIEQNFDVIHNGIFRELPNDYNLLLNNKGLHENIFSLYLIQDNIYYIYEFELPEKIIEKISQLEYEDYENNQLLIEHWWTKVYEPIIEDISDESVNMNRYSNRVSRTRRFSYEDFNYTYEIDVILELYTRDLWRMETTGNALVYIDDHRVYYNGRFVDDAPMLGITNADVDIRLDSNNDDVFRRVEWETYTNYPSPKFTINWGYGYGPISINYSDQSDNSSGSFSIPSSASRQYKLINVNNQTPTLDVGDSHQIYYSIEETKLYNGTHYITADFNFDIFLINKHTIVDWDSYTLRGSYD